MCEKSFVKKNSESDLGEIVSLVTNHYSIDIPEYSIYHYNVQIDYHENLNNKKRALKLSERVLIMNNLSINNSEPDGLFYDQANKCDIKFGFDGRESLYTCIPLKLEENIKKIVNIEYKKKNYSFIVTIKKIAILNLEKVDRSSKNSIEINYEEIIKALSVILKKDFYITKVHTRLGIYPKIKDNRIETKENPIGINKAAVLGHRQKVRILNKNINLIIDRMATAFYSTITLKELYDKQLKKLKIPKKLIFKKEYQDLISFLNKNLNGLQVITLHSQIQRKFKVFEITKEPIKKLSFFDKQQQKLISILELYETKYEIKLDKSLPCLNVGDEKNPIYFPFEVCKIAPFQNAKQLSKEETIEMMSFANSQKIEQRFDFIQEKLDLIELKNKQLLNDFSIKINKKPIQVDGIQLLEPKLNYSNVDNFQPNHGKWDMKGKKVLKSVDLKLNELCVVNLTKNLRSSEINSFIEHLSTVSKEIGIEIDKPFFYDENSFQNTLKGEDTEEFKKVLDEIVKFYSPKKPKLILFLISKHKGDKVYKNIKSQTEINYGLITQCVLDKTVRSVLDFYSKNKSTSFTSKNSLQRQNGEKILNALLLKMNTKLGGTNCTISSDSCEISKLREDLMIIGADVTHPSEFDNFEFSVCSVVASFDSTYSQYVSVVKIQEVPRQEMITQMYDIVHELLELFLEKKFQNLKAKEQEVDVNDKNLIYSLLPQNIFFYRDGVSASQYNKLKEIEIKNMEKAFVDFSKNKKLNKVYNPKINFIIVHKRQITRLKTFESLKKDTSLLKDKSKEINKAPTSFDFSNYFSTSLVNEKKNDNEYSDFAKSFDILPGTLVDDLKILNSKSEFYLFSHYCNKGTKRPTHYDLLINESYFVMPEIQKFIYYLCYIFGVDSKSLSIPTPVKFAHLAAYRARKHILALNQNELCNINQLKQTQVFEKKKNFCESQLSEILIEQSNQSCNQQEISSYNSEKSNIILETEIIQSESKNSTLLSFNNEPCLSQNQLCSNNPTDIVDSKNRSSLLVKSLYKSEDINFPLLKFPQSTSDQNLIENMKFFNLFYAYFDQNSEYFYKIFSNQEFYFINYLINYTCFFSNLSKDSFMFYYQCFIFYYEHYIPKFNKHQLLQDGNIDFFNESKFKIFSQYLQKQYKNNIFILSQIKESSKLICSNYYSTFELQKIFYSTYEDQSSLFSQSNSKNQKIPTESILDNFSDFNKNEKKNLFFLFYSYFHENLITFKSVFLARNWPESNLSVDESLILHLRSQKHINVNNFCQYFRQFISFLNFFFSKNEAQKVISFFCLKNIAVFKFKTKLFDKFCIILNNLCNSIEGNLELSAQNLFNPLSHKFPPSSNSFSKNQINIKKKSSSSKIENKITKKKIKKKNYDQPLSQNNQIDFTKSQIEFDLNFPSLNSNGLESSLKNQQLKSASNNYDLLSYRSILTQDSLKVSVASQDDYKLQFPSLNSNGLESNLKNQQLKSASNNFDLLSYRSILTQDSLKISVASQDDYKFQFPSLNSQDLNENFKSINIDSYDNKENYYSLSNYESILKYHTQEFSKNMANLSSYSSVLAEKKLIDKQISKVQKNEQAKLEINFDSSFPSLSSDELNKNLKSTIIDSIDKKENYSLLDDDINLNSKKNLLESSKIMDNSSSYSSVLAKKKLIDKQVIGDEKIEQSMSKNNLSKITEKLKSMIKVNHNLRSSLYFL